MKKILFFFALLFMGAVTAFAQTTTNTLTYQTIVRNAQNQLVFSQNNVSVTVEVCNAAGSVVRYSETHTGLSTNANGLLTLMVGGGTPISGTWTDIDWSDAAIRTTITYDPGTGTVTIPSGIAPITAVPYALQAGNAGSSASDIGDAIHDSIVNNISAQIHDSIVNSISTADLCSTIETNCTNVALRNGNNEFTGINTVPSGFDINTTNSTNCSNVVVNACDLFAVFDSLNRRINSLYDSLPRLNDEITAINNSVPPTATAPTFQNVGSTSMTIEANNTSTSGPITSYKYCYSVNSDMSGATCQTVSSPTLNVTGLTPNTIYYATVEATNRAGSTLSETANVRTPAQAPTAEVTIPEVNAPASFEVEVENVDPKEMEGATVQVYYVLKGTDDCPEKESSSYSTYSEPVTVTNGGSTSISQSGLEFSTEYCVIVKVSNSDSTTICGPYTVTTGADVTLTITQLGDGTVNLCGTSSVSVTYTATPSDGGSYTYNWSGTPTSTSGNTATYNYSSAGTYTVTVTATHTSPAYTMSATASTTVNDSPAALFRLCVDPYLNEVSVGNNNCSSFSWKNANNEEVSTATIVAVSESIPAGIYTVTGVNASGCSATKQAVLGINTPHPCNRSPHTSGFGNTFDGQEIFEVGRGIIAVRDYDGNTYPVVEINGRCWMAMNLRTTHYADGSSINFGETLESHSVRYAYYPPLRSPLSGLLYNLPATMNNNWSIGTQGVCPTGWHVPDMSDFYSLSSSSYQGTVYFSSSCLWDNLNNSVGGLTPNSYYNPDRNITGFSAVPAGLHYGNYSTSFGGEANFWSSRVNEEDHSGSFCRIGYSSSVFTFSELNGRYGFSVRCIRN